MTRFTILACAMLILAGCEFLRDFGQAPPAGTQAENPIDATPPPSLVPQELLREVGIDWTGPLDTLVRRLTEEAGWDYIEAGPEPAVPPIVEIHATSSPIILVLRDAGIQAAEMAAVTVDARARQVRIDWSTTQGDPI